MHPVLESLRNTDKQWLIDTLYAFNAGNVEKFQGFKSAWGQQVTHAITHTAAMCSHHMVIHTRAQWREEVFDLLVTVRASFPLSGQSGLKLKTPVGTNHL